MIRKLTGLRLGLTAVLFLVALLAIPAFPAVKNIAVIMSAGSKTADVQLAELVKLCKGTQKAWADGRSFMLVMKDPGTPDMHTPVQKLFGMAPADFKAAVPKLNESRQLVKIVESDEELIRTVEATPGAVGVVDVYSINSSVKVLRVDGKLPFDVGYALKGN
jgi:ABC-type phosphate transport system substrate-binding protein